MSSPPVNHKVFVGELPLKMWCMEEATRTGKTFSSIYNRFYRGSYPKLSVRRVNKRVIFVKP